MGKITLEDKMRMQTLREQGYGAAAICSMYPDRGWNVRSVHAICVRVDKRGSVMERKTGSGRPVSTKTAENIAAVKKLICSQESQPGTSKSTREIATQLQISQTTVMQIAKKKLQLKVQFDN